MGETARAFKIKIPCRDFICSGGTWAAQTNSGLPVQNRTAAAGTTKIAIPIPIPSRDGQYGAKLKSVKAPVRLATAAAVSTPTATLYKRNMLAVAAAGTDQTASSITITSTGLTLTAAATDRMTTHTVSSPDWDWDSAKDEDYTLQLTFNLATTSALKVYDAVAYFEMLT